VLVEASTRTRDSGRDLHWLTRALRSLTIARYLLGCLFCIVLMACENFAIALVDVGDDDIKHKRIDDAFMLAWLGIWMVFNLVAAVTWWRAVRRNKPEWRLQEEARMEQTEADQLKEEAEQLESKHKYLEAAQLFDEAAKHSPKAGDKVDLKKRAEHARADADRMQSERPAYRGERR
jgi:type VI protein secretion system component VasK